MVLTRPQKEQLVEEMSQYLGDSKAIVLINYQGLKVKEIRELKKKLRESAKRGSADSGQGIGFQIVKNTLLKIALKKEGIAVPEELLDQPVAIVWGQDEVTPAKITSEFGRLAENLKIIGGIINKDFADVSLISQLAALPSREELYAKLVGTLNAPMYRLVNALQGNLRSLVYILGQYNKSKI